MSEELRIELLALQHYAPKCSSCNTVATRSYRHVAGHKMFACENDSCLMEKFCLRCNQVWYSDDAFCEACGSAKSYHHIIATDILALPFSEILKTLE